MHSWYGIKPLTSAALAYASYTLSSTASLQGAVTVEVTCKEWDFNTSYIHIKNEEVGATGRFTGTSLGWHWSRSTGRGVTNQKSNSRHPEVKQELMDRQIEQTAVSNPDCHHL